MTVAELIEALRQMNPDATVVTSQGKYGWGEACTVEAGWYDSSTGFTPDMEEDGDTDAVGIS